ncbi:MAG: hypothetical protein LBB91_04450 [Clostridiales bacterium]|jgi:hypothetical protein|nr:hypothetical protein [Clostridiales bacterium]
MSNLDIDENESSSIFEESKNYFRGTIGAILGAIIGAIPWAIAYHYGRLAAVLGLVIGFCAVKGYEILGGKAGRGKALIIILATAFGVIFGQVAGDFLDLRQMVADGELEGFAYSDIPALYFYFIIYNTAEFIKASLPNLLLGFVFAGLGIWNIIKSIWTNPSGIEPANESQEESPKESNMEFLKESQNESQEEGAVNDDNYRL